MPGVVVSVTTANSGNVGLADPSGQLFLVGLCERGDVTQPVLISGFADAQNQLGARVSYGYLYDQLNTFFAEGGTQAYVQRVVGPGATTGTLTLVDNGSGGAAKSTLRIDAASPGSWSSDVSVLVSTGTRAATFRLGIFYQGTQVADYNNLASVDAAVSAMSANIYVQGTNLGSTNTGVTALPKNSTSGTATPLSAGTDDRASVTADTYVAALDLFVPGLGDGAVAIPGLSDAVHDGIIAHCENPANNRIGLLSFDQGADVATLAALGVSYDTSFAGLFAPWVLISDGSLGQRAISPEGFVAAKRAVAHSTIGAWAVPAGASGVANGGSSGVVGVDQSFNSDDGNTLDASHVSVIRLIANSVRLYGWRSLSQDEINYPYLKTRDLINRIVVEALAAMEVYVFSTIDGSGHLLAAINGELTGLLQPIADAGGLYALSDPVSGNPIDAGYLVRTDSSVNSPASLAANIVRAVMEIRDSPTGATISITVVKVNASAGF